MAEIEPIPFDPSLDLASLTPEHAVLLDNRQELHQFEGSLVEVLLPSEYDDHLDRWSHRGYVANLLLPKGFFGTLADIRVQLLEEPYDQLVEKVPQCKRKDVDYARQNTVGLHVSAALMSTSLNSRGMVDAYSWVYRRLPNQFVEHGEYNRRVLVDSKARAIIEQKIRKNNRDSVTHRGVSSGSATPRRGTLRSENPFSNQN